MITCEQSKLLQKKNSDKQKSKFELEKLNLSKY